MTSAGGLDDVLADHDSRLAQWRKDRIQALQLEAQQAACELRRERVQLRDLEASLGATAQLTQEAAKVHAEGVRVSEAVREAAGAAAKRYEVAAQAREQLLTVEKARLEELKAEESALQKQDATIAARTKEISRFMGLYQDRLGLTLSRVAPQTVRVTFTLLNRSDPALEYAFTLGLSAPSGAGLGYQVQACSPALPTEQVESLLGRLNAADAGEASALPAFVCGMRRAFQASIPKAC